jgi:hypothetical protein
VIMLNKQGSHGPSLIWILTIGSLQRLSIAPLGRYRSYPNNAGTRSVTDE